MKLVANTGYRRYQKAQGQAKAFAIDPAKVEADAQFDGLFVLRVHTPLTAPQAILRYRSLLVVEDTFQSWKGPAQDQARSTTRPARRSAATCFARSWP